MHGVLVDASFAVIRVKLAVHDNDRPLQDGIHVCTLDLWIERWLDASDERLTVDLRNKLETHQEAHRFHRRCLPDSWARFAPTLPPPTVPRPWTRRARHPAQAWAFSWSDC